MSSISPFDIISVAIPDPKNILWIPASPADTAAVNPNGIKTLLANGLFISSINGNTGFSNEPRSLLRNPPDCIILNNWVFENLISVDELFAKAYKRFTTCLLVNNNWCEQVIL